MDFWIIVDFICYLIICVWWAIWFVYFVLRFKQIKKLLNYKDYIGIMGNFIIILAIILKLIMDPFGDFFPVITIIVIFVGGWILVIWVILTIIKLINKVEKAKDNISVFIFSSKLVIGFFYLLFWEIPIARFLLWYILIILYIIWSGKMMHILINIHRFREKGEDKKKIKEKIVAEQVDKKKRDEILDCPMCKNELSAKLKERYSKGRTTYCTYCGSEIE